VSTTLMGFIARGSTLLVGEGCTGADDQADALKPGKVHPGLFKSRITMLAEGQGIENRPIRELSRGALRAGQKRPSSGYATRCEILLRRRHIQDYAPIGG